MLRATLGQERLAHVVPKHASFQILVWILDFGPIAVPNCLCPQFFSLAGKMHFKLQFQNIARRFRAEIIQFVWKGWVSMVFIQNLIELLMFPMLDSSLAKKPVSPDDTLLQIQTLLVWLPELFLENI